MEQKEVGGIFLSNKLGKINSIEKLEIGFTNEVYSINDRFILKICKDQDNEKSFAKEAYFYTYFKNKIPVPAMIVYDNTKKVCARPFIIYYKIMGDTLYSKWHLLSDNERKDITKQLCQILRRINSSKRHGFVKKFKLKSSVNWHDTILGRIAEHLKEIERKKILSVNSVRKINNFVKRHDDVLGEQKISLVYWDVHFDNILIRNNKIVGLLDFERTELASVDFILDVVKRMVDYPEKYMAEKFKSLAKKKDYAKLLDWFKEFYPELFEFEKLDERLGLYAVEHDLATLLGWPNSKRVKQMIAKTIGYKGHI